MKIIKVRECFETNSSSSHVMVYNPENKKFTDLLNKKSLKKAISIYESDMRKITNISIDSINKLVDSYKHGISRSYMYYLDDFLEFVKEHEKREDIIKSIDKIFEYLKNSITTITGFNKYKEEFINFVTDKSIASDDIISKYVKGYDFYLQHKKIIDNTVDTIYYSHNDNYECNNIIKEVKTAIRDMFSKEDYETLSYAHSFFWDEYAFKDALESLYNYHMDFIPKEIKKEIKNISKSGAYMFEIEGAGNGFQSHTEEFLYRWLHDIEKKKNTKILVV